MSAEHSAHYKYSVNGTIYLFKAHLFRRFLQFCLRLPGSHYQVHHSRGCVFPAGTPVPALLLLFLVGSIREREHSAPSLSTASSSAYILTFSSNMLTHPHARKANSHITSYMHIATDNHMYTQTHSIFRSSVLSFEHTKIP